MINRTADEVINFINKFKSYNKNQVLEKTFLEGYCYYFAIILKERFKEGKILYDKVENHFVFSYNNKLYDITGNVTNKHELKNISEEWNNTVVKQCVLKEL